MALEGFDPATYRFPADVVRGVQGKHVLITGAGKHHGLGQAFAFACGLNGAASVGVHFHRSYTDGLETVELIRSSGGNAYPVQADVTNAGDLWATRSHVIRQAGEKVPDIVICNSGLSEKGYVFGKAPKEVEGESTAMRRARARQAFIDNLEDSRRVIDTKVDGFLNMVHLWAGEAAHAKKKIHFVFISSRQAFDPGAGVPGYVIANWAVLALPPAIKANLGKQAELISSFSVAYPFVRTGMTEAYAGNPKVFGRWQPRMLETDEAASALLQLLSRPLPETDGRIFQLEVASDPEKGDSGVKTAWAEMRIAAERMPPA
jgi:NAD(P)-dependent dehydrogenase (short-subunit alcohol dehydrogenase family)